MVPVARAAMGRGRAQATTNVQGLQHAVRARSEVLCTFVGSWQCGLWSDGGTRRLPREKGSKVEQIWDRLGASVACKMQAAAVWSLDTECFDGCCG